MLLGVDVGGTFTDAVLVDGSGPIATAKVPSTPSAQQHGVLDAIRAVLARAGCTAADVSRFAHGMTVATNALLEGRAARTALIATAGFTDVIELGRQARPRLYELGARAPEPLVPGELRFGAEERMGPEGVVRELEDRQAREMLARVIEKRPESVAIVLLHSYADDTHERRLAELLAELDPQLHVSASSELVGTFREYERTATTTLDAALSPLLRSYLEGLATASAREGISVPEVMQSSGGLTDIASAGAHAALTVLSGPAGGVGGALLLAELAGEPDVLCFDMGGTSCDVCVIDDGHVAETAERSIAGHPLALPALDIHTVGAGGGSIAWRDDGGALRVGPASAGARPGPACYGLGGEQPTVTDANLLLGRLPADGALAGGLTLHAAAAERVVGALADELGLDLRRTAEGIVRVAEAAMLSALRLMTVERGVDPRRFALMPFGGAGPLHATALARELGIGRVLCPAASGVLCALGLAAAAPRRDLSRTVMLAGETFADGELERERASLLSSAATALGRTPARARLRYELRYRGQSFELGVEEELQAVAASSAAFADRQGSGATYERDSLREAFADAHHARYGYRDEHSDVEIVNIRASVWGAAPALRPRGGEDVARQRACTIVIDGEPVRGTLMTGTPAPGTHLRGPMLCALAESTLLIGPGWRGSVDEHGTIRLEDGAGAAAGTATVVE
jgi:N-methylhydantoinase A